MRRVLFAAVAVGVSCVLLFAAGCGSSTSHLRLLNAIPIQADLDMLIDSKNVASAVAYGAASTYASVSAGSRHVQIEPTGVPSPIVDQSTGFSSGTFNTVMESSSGVTVFSDSNTTPSSGNVSVRVINASHNVGAADVYIVSSGTGIGTATPTFAGVAFPSATGYQTLAAGSYQVLFTFPGTTSVELSTSSLSFTSGQVRTVVVLDGQTGGVTTSVLADLN